MTKRRFLFLVGGMALGLGLTLTVGPELRQKVLFFATREIAFKAVQKSCKGDDKCRAEMRPAADECSHLATQGKREWIDQGRLVGCLQKHFFRQSCRGETRCVASLDENYDRCFRLFYPPGVAPDDANAAESFGLCLRAGG